ncbi:MAG: putative ribosome biogenesis protein bop1, partial [Streblomastix strix]
MRENEDGLIPNNEQLPEIKDQKNQNDNEEDEDSEDEDEDDEQKGKDKNNTIKKQQRNQISAKQIRATKHAIWSVASPAPEKDGILLTIEHRKPITHISWHNNGEYLSSVSSSSSDSTLLIHNIRKRESVKPTAKTKHIIAGCFHPKKPQFFVANDKHIEIYSLDKGQAVRRLHGGMRQITSISIHPQGSHLIASTTDGKIVWFDLGAEATTPYRTLTAKASPFYSTAFHPDASNIPLFAATTSKGTVQIVHSRVSIKKIRRIVKKKGKIKEMNKDDEINEEQEEQEEEEYEEEITPIIVPVKLLFGPVRRVMRYSRYRKDGDNEDEDGQRSHLIASTTDGKIVWFDLGAEATTPYRTLT